MEELAVTSKGQVTIPKHIRQKLGIRTGSRVRFRLVGDHAQLDVVSAPTAVTCSGYGLLVSKRKTVPADFDVADLAGKRK